MSVDAKRRQWLDRLLLAAVLAAGTLASALVYEQQRLTDQLRAQHLRSLSAGQVMATFDADLVQLLGAVRSAALMAETHDDLRRDDFNRYAQLLQKELPGLMMLEWQPEVTEAQRDAFERQARAQGLDGFAMIEPGDAPGHWRPAAIRPVHVPVLFGWPEDLSPIGLDLNFDPDGRMRSKHLSARTGRPQASTSFAVIVKAGAAAERQGFAVSMVVHDKTGQQTRGYVAGVLGLPALLKRTAEAAGKEGLDLRVYERSAAGRQLIFAAGDKAAEVSESDEALSVDVAGQPWELVLRPRPGQSSGADRSHAILLGLAGLAATLLLTLGLRLSQRRRQALALLQQQQAVQSERLHNIIEGTGVGSWEYDFNSNRAQMNERWMAIAGYQPGEWNPGPDYDWRNDCHEDDKPAVLAALREHLRGATDHYEAEYRQRRRDGSWVWVASRGKVIRRDATGKPLELVGMLMEIDARKAAEARVLELNNTLEKRVAQRSAELEAAQQRLRQLDLELARTEGHATLSTVVASVSHELSTPMSNSQISTSTVLDRLQALKAGLGSGALRRSELEHAIEQMQEGARLTQRNLERAVELLKSLRQVANDQASENRRSFDLAEVVGEIVDTMAPLLKRTRHRVTVNVPAGIAMDSYPGPLGQVLINLINNALLHAFEGWPDAGEISIGVVAEDDSDVVTLCVHDNGRGMSSDVRAKIFQPFFSTKAGSGGTGLGLAIVDKLVSGALGGQLRLESTPGLGTTFFVQLPLHAPD